IIADPKAVHPVIAAMNGLDYAVATLGNHDFNYGLVALGRAYAQARFPVVCCNVRKSDGSPWFPPSIVIERTFVDESRTARRLKLGVIGVAPPQIAQWDEAHVRGRLTTVDIVEAVGAELSELRAHVDLIVVLCHSGISRLASTRGEENAGQDLAKLDGVDALFLGHQHLLLPGQDFVGLPGVDTKCGRIHGKPAVMAGFWGSHLGIIDLWLEMDTGWQIVEAQVEVRPIAQRDADGRAIALVESDASVLEAAKTAHEATLRHIRTPIGKLATRLQTYFALIGDSPTVDLINAAQRAYAASLTPARADLASLPMLSAAAPFKCGGRSGPYSYTDIAAGPLAIKDVADIYPYPNSLRVVKVDGVVLREWLERSASIFRRIDPSQPGEQPLLGPAFACYNFDVIDGVHYTVDVTQSARYDESGALVAPGAHRIHDLTFKGAPVDPNQPFLVVTNNYRASGGGFAGCDGTSIVIEAPDANRDVVLRYIASRTEIAPKSDGAWRFAPWPSAVVAIYLTSPAASDLPTPPGLKLTPMGLAHGGFLKVRVETA
ncbi:MAG TPA: bifunctional 2',3'-cyclic-nucleotide 2'-phosphodiesterase/3'-nucleotidase, partial [Roseiarcus sp.]|nr:bifunctional 2',3'-cyclic-nucleotide 2'-phosphodiesterase/3'-nucleotidase [Roseiarcus sp.]